MISIKVKDAKLLIESRIKSGMSYRDVAKISKINYSTICKVEKANSPVTPRIAKALCSALNLNFDDVFEIVDVGA